MATKHDLQDWIQNALRNLGGHASLLAVAKHMWNTHASDLRASGDLFFTWQYDMRWAANALRRQGIMKPAEISPVGVWEVTEV